MERVQRLYFVAWVTVICSCALALQRPPPRYSQQYMPETSFTCRNKIVGSYYADPETDCQVFHVCVSVSGIVQDYKFLCPNDTAFDQESQTCADWYDVDCEAATLYYASDNFDLYRIGSGLESPHYDSIRSDAEPQDHLQRSETSDPVRSSANSVNRISSSNYNSNGNTRDLRGSNTGNFYNSRNGKEDDYDNDKSYKDEIAQDTKKKGVRKISRKQQFNDNGNNYVSSSTAAPVAASNQNTYTGFYSGNHFNQRTNNGFVSSSSARPQENYNRNQNGQGYNAPSSTHKPTTNYQNNYNFQSPSTTTTTTTAVAAAATASKTTIYNNAYNSNFNQQNTASFSQSTTAKPTNYNKNYQSYNNAGQFVQPTTLQPSTNYQPTDYTNYQRNYNNIQRGNGNNLSYQSTTVPPLYDNTYSNNNNNNGQYRPATSTRQDAAAQTTKYFANFPSASYAPTTYSPATNKYIDNSQAQTVTRNTEAAQYYDKSSQSIKSSSQYYDSTKTPKKATQYNYDGSNPKYYTESSTNNYEFARSSIGIGFSPASINHLAETPRSTTPVPRRVATATTYNPNSFNANTQKPPQSQTTPRGSTYVSGSARPFSSTTRLSSTTTPRPKSGKKNDYDYAYYDNTAALEYDSLDLEHVTGNKESTKIARN